MTDQPPPIDRDATALALPADLGESIWRFQQSGAPQPRSLRLWEDGKGSDGLSRFSITSWGGDRWAGGLVGTAAWLGLTSMDIETARYSSKPTFGAG